jgi:putative ABC transport system substrate-binding protein
MLLSRHTKRRQFITLLGGAAAWPMAARAQHAGTPYRIGFLALIPGEDKTLMAALLGRLHELGYSERSNMSFKYRSAEGDPERLAPLARELLDDKPDVLIAGFGTLAALAAKAATTAVPVVFTTVGDPWAPASSQASIGPAEMSRASRTRPGTFRASACSVFWS